ncbi:peroxisomal membrane anchor protein conserved region-domain-containing protein [Chaetomium tenue]|uniref:Peroxisomal membrane anchor protein conserved region-domain-containing protein n=1 Tax=Chaetomium tenue TaxID=1854479 RepID=A0ACB7PFX6_9PEZI|nr:peroxisomal membrane anchor protein conserved region-domain-containing protein [Chaetomium globosum]
MAIREDLVASAVKFLQDPSVASSPVEKKVAFLQAKNLTQEEVSAALARAAAPAPAQGYAPQSASSAVAQPPQYYGQYPPQYPPYGWQQPPPQPVPRRDWRDWFIMATVVSGVSYGLYSLGKRYVYPLVSPPTPERLEQDKKSIDEQFEKTFALVDQLAKDTETLKTAEKERTERLDTALVELETTISQLKSANKRRDDEAQRVRDDVQNLRDSIPRGLDNQKDLTDTRLREVNAELKSLKTLITQRLNPTATSASVSNYLRPAVSGGATPSSPATTPTPMEKAEAAILSASQDSSASAPRPSPFSSGMQAKASIPAWQMMAAKSAESPSTPPVNGTDAGSSSGAQEASGSA